MAEGRSYWTLRRRIRANVARQMANLEGGDDNRYHNIDNVSVEVEATHTSDSEWDNDTNEVPSYIQTYSDPGQCTDSHMSNVSKSDTLSVNSDEDIEQYLDESNRLLYEDNSDSDSNDETANFSDDLRDWAVRNQVPHNSLSDLLKILRPSHPDLPKDPRTLLKSQIHYNIVHKCGGQYYYFGIENGVLKQIQNFCESLDDGFCLKLQLNIDGLPLFKSTSHQFWPILGRLTNVENKVPFLIGLFYGEKKPNNLDDYLDEFLTEYNDIQTNGTGIQYNEKHFHIELHSIICDTPARAFVKCVKSYSGYHGCDKCTQDGEWKGKMTFPETNAPLRTDASFGQMSDDDHHTGVSPFTKIDLGMVSQFPLDYMHLVCLGVMKRMILLWMKGPLPCRLGVRAIQQISDNLLMLKHSFPAEFARKPRSLSEIDRWKATEFRQFLLYSGLLVLHNSIHQNLYGNFVLLSVAMHILLNEKLCQCYNSYAHDLLVAFVTHFYQIYGKDMAVYNVHGLVHLAAEAERYGSLENISAFPFENYLFSIKNLVRKPTFPLSQVIRRLSEKTDISVEKVTYPLLKKSHHHGPLPDELVLGSQYSIVITEKFQLKLNEKDSCVRIRGKVCKIRNIVEQDDEIYVVYSEFDDMENFFTSPLESRLLGILQVTNLNNSIQFCKVSEIEAKCVMMPHQTCQREYVVVPYTDAVWSQYAVVEFYADNSVEIVPASWITGKGKQCHWPHWKSTSKIQTAIKNAVKPTVEFHLLGVRVMFQGDYEQARKKLKLAEVTSDLQTDAEDNAEEINRRKRKANPKFLHEDSSTEEDEPVLAGPSTPKRKKSPVKQARLPSVPIVPPPYLDKLTQRQIEPQASVRVTPRETLFQTPVHSVHQAKETPRMDKALERTLISGIEEIKSQVSLNTRLLNALIKKVDTGISASKDDETEYASLEVFPLKTRRQAERYDESLKDDSKFKSLAKSLGAIGGENLKHTTRRILATVFSNDLAKETNFVGKGDKLAFSKLKLNAHVTKAVRCNKLCGDVTDAEVSFYVKEWLRNACDREGGRKKREEQKKERLREQQQREQEQEQEQDNSE